MKVRKVFIICIFILVTLVISLKNFIAKEIYSIQFENNIKEYLNENYNIIDSVSFSGDYKLNLDLNMNSEFCSLDYFAQKPIMEEISKKLEDLYIKYRDKVNKVDSQINYTYGMIKFNFYDYFYNTSFISSTIYKNGNSLEYTDGDYLIESLKSKLADVNLVEKSYIESYLKGIDNEEIYKEILCIKDDDNFLLEIAYQYLLKLYNDKEYNENILFYKNKLNNYKNSIELFNKIDEYERERKEKYFKYPKIGMTKQEVINTNWGEPKQKLLDNPNSSLRFDTDGEESFFYTRGTTRIMVNFKYGKVDSFYVTKKGEWTGKKVYSVEEY